MLPAELHGPGKTIRFESPDLFLQENSQRYPNLDPDFILQICFEHPDRFNEILPGFNPALHTAKRISQTAAWVFTNVRYDNNEEVDFWGEQFDAFLESPKKIDYVIFAHMVTKKTWLFPPVIIEARFARQLGARPSIGEPYYLIEGTHRTSYLRRMLERKMVDPQQPVELIEIAT